MFHASMFLNYIVSEFYLLAFLYLGYVASRLHIVKIICRHINEEPSMYFVGRALNLCVFT